MRHDLELSKVMKRLVTAVMVFICGAAGYQFYLLMIAENWWPAATDIHPIGAGVLIVLASAAFGFILAPLFWWSIKKFGQFFESKIQNVSVPDLIVGMIGLIIGLLLANLIAIPLAKLPGGIGVYVAVLLNVALGYWGVRFFAKRGDDFWNILTNIDIKSKLTRSKKKGESPAPEEMQIASSCAKIIDTREDGLHRGDDSPSALRPRGAPGRRGLDGPDAPHARTPRPLRRYGSPEGQGADCRDT